MAKAQFDKDSGERLNPDAVEGTAPAQSATGESADVRQALAKQNAKFEEAWSERVARHNLDLNELQRQLADSQSECGSLKLKLAAAEELLAAATSPDNVTTKVDVPAANVATEPERKTGRTSK